MQRASAHHALEAITINTHSSTLAYSTNSATDTRSDLAEVRRGHGSLRRPVVAKQPFSRLSDGQRHPVTVRRVPVVGAETVGSQPA